jgi:hypothetical protein
LKAKLALEAKQKAKSIPPCTSLNYPDCKKDQKSAADKGNKDDKDKDKPVAYPSPNSPLEESIQHSINNLDNAEKGLGKKLDLLANKITPV